MVKEREKEDRGAEEKMRREENFKEKKRKGKKEKTAKVFCQKTAKASSDGLCGTLISHSFISPHLNISLSPVKHSKFLHCAFCNPGSSKAENPYTLNLFRVISPFLI